MVDLLDPREGELICDPAAGSGGFLFRAFEHVRAQIGEAIQSEKNKARADIETKGLDPDQEARQISCATACVTQLFANLLANGLTHGAAQEPIRVLASTAEGAFQLSISNAGEPISPAALEHLFQPFFRGAVRPSQQGLGSGLCIASEIASAHGGTIDAVSMPTETRFIFRVPLTPSPP